VSVYIRYRNHVCGRANRHAFTAPHSAFNGIFSYASFYNLIFGEQQLIQHILKYSSFLSLRSAIRLEDQVSHPYKRTSRTCWSTEDRRFLEADRQTRKKVLPVMKFQNSLPCSQKQATCLYSAPNECNPHPHILYIYPS
jgi:hypothetical protein